MAKCTRLGWKIHNYLYYLFSIYLCCFWAVRPTQLLQIKNLARIWAVAHSTIKSVRIDPSPPKKKEKKFTVSGFVFGADSRWATLSEVMDDLAQLLPSRLPPEHEAVPANAGKRCHLWDGKRKALGGEEEWDTRRRRQRRRRRRRRCEGVWTSSPSDGAALLVPSGRYSTPPSGL